MRTIKMIAILFFILIINSCNKDESSPVESNNQLDWEGDKSKINTAYNDSILFTSTRSLGTSFSPNIYIMHKNGSGIRAVTNKFFTFGASFSPRRFKVLYIADTVSSGHARVLYSMDCDGKNKKIISKPGEDVWGEACSPDGQKIAYTVLQSGKGKIRVLNTADNSVIDVTGFYGSNISGRLSWSKDSKGIVFDGIGNDRIGFAKADGSGYSELFPSDMGCYSPQYSPDGKSVAFSSYKLINAEYYSNIFIYSLESKTYKSITTIVGFSNNPTWSQDGNSIIFSSRDIGDAPSFLFKVDLTTNVVTQLTFGNGSDWSPYYW